MNRNEIWIWLAMGLVPYWVGWRCLAGGIRTLEVRALFWSLTVRLRPSGRHDWTLRVPLIERLQSVTWEAVMRLRESQPPDC